MTFVHPAKYETHWSIFWNTLWGQTESLHISLISKKRLLLLEVVILLRQMMNVVATTLRGCRKYVVYGFCPKHEIYFYIYELKVALRLWINYIISVRIDIYSLAVPFTLNISSKIRQPVLIFQDSHQKARSRRHLFNGLLLDVFVLFCIDINLVTALVSLR